MDGLNSGKKGIGFITHFSTEYFPSKLGAEVKNIDIHPGEEYHDRKEILLSKALKDLFDDKHHLDCYPESDRVLNLGAGLDYFNLPEYINSSDRKYHNWQKYSYNTYAFIKKLALEHKICGGVNVYVSACVASNHAIGQSFRMLKSGSSKAIVTGGVDSMLNPLHYMGFHKLGALSDWQGNPSESCRPFDKKRCGLVLGEGAALFLLENLNKADPEDILAEIVGYASTMDAFSVTDPEPEGESLASAALQAIEEAGIRPNDIDCVHLHGTGTPKNAPAEANAMKIVFKERFGEIPVFSLKGQLGHLIAACGAMEILGVIYSLRYQRIPPTVNFHEPDPSAPLHVITGKPLERDIRFILKLNSAFGGENSAFVVKRYE